jgi:hypothetical protein
VDAYGLRLHVVFRADAAPELKVRLQRDFQLREIAPTLEDVFIRVVEGGNA